MRACWKYLDPKMRYIAPGDYHKDKLDPDDNTVPFTKLTNDILLEEKYESVRDYVTGKWSLNDVDAYLHRFGVSTDQRATSRDKKYVENRIGQSEHQGSPSRPVFSPRSSNLVADVRELACISLYVHSASESARQFCSRRGENGRTQHQFFMEKKYI
jgi:hypothetical protein